jgi:hypothetical protein
VFFVHGVKSSCLMVPKCRLITYKHNSSRTTKNTIKFSMFTIRAGLVDREMEGIHGERCVEWSGLLY